MKGFSIILCTYNSEQKLSATLQHLEELVVPKGYALEIIMVDNGSSDGTLALFDKVIRERKAIAAARVVHEPRAGQVFARMKGVGEARYDYVVFCDDDNWLAPDYLEVASSILASDSTIGAMGGYGIAVTRNPQPAWFASSQSIYACGRQAERSGMVSKRGYLWGAGLVARRELLKKVYHPDYPMVSSGRTGVRLTSGDDVELCMRILLLGYELWYEEKLRYQHALTPDKLTEDYRDRLINGMVEFQPIKQQYVWEIEKKRYRLYPVVVIKHIILYILLKMKLIRSQQYAIINPFYPFPLSPFYPLISAFRHHAPHL